MRPKFTIPSHSLYYANIELTNSTSNELKIKSEIKQESIDSDIEPIEPTDSSNLYDEISFNNFKKITTLDIPNHYISDIFYDNFFITSNTGITFFNSDSVILLFIGNYKAAVKLCLKADIAAWPITRSLLSYSYACLRQHTEAMAIAHSVMEVRT